jgi:hypothetical protein
MPTHQYPVPCKVWKSIFQPDQKKKSDSITQTIVEDLESIGKSKNSLSFAQNLQTAWTLSHSVIRRSSFFVVEKTEYPSVSCGTWFFIKPSRG